MFGFYIYDMYVHVSHLNHDEGKSADTGYLHWLLEEGAHVAVVGVVHLLQEAAGLLRWSVADQTLQDHSWSATLAV